MSIHLPLADEPTPCSGRWDLFDSRRIEHHKEAADLCGRCPVTDACAELLHDVATTPSSLRGGRPEGTWAGQLIGGEQRPPGPVPQHKEVS